MTHLEARMKCSLAPSRPLQFSELKEGGLSAFAAVHFLSPLALEGWQRAHCSGCSSKDGRPSGGSQLLSFVLGEIGNQLLWAQEAPRQKQEGQLEGSRSCRRV